MAFLVFSNDFFSWRPALQTPATSATVFAIAEHNDLNVLALAGRVITRDRAIAIVSAWLDTAFEGGRHARRIALMEPR